MISFYFCVNCWILYTNNRNNYKPYLTENVKWIGFPRLEIQYV